MMHETNVMEAWDRAARTYRDLMGYAPGERLSTPEAITAALNRIAETHADRCLLEQYAITHQGRPLHLLTLASPENRSRLEEIRRASTALCGSPDCAPPADLPVTVWVIANVHGDEHSTAEAALLLACYLVEPEDTVLRDVVVGIDPLQNPDGRARSVNAYYSLFGLTSRTDPYAAEHHDPWPGGRGNHYCFDMNRDWFPMTQPESRGRVASFLRWRPQVVADLHEMWTDSRYFFPPPSPPLNPHMAGHIPEWWGIMGRDLAHTFEANGWDYWTAETFDAFYPGYGEAFPSIHGSVGMTFEQASAAGLATDRKDGTVQTFQDAVLHHFGAALSVCRTAAEKRTDLLEAARSFFESAQIVPPGEPAAYLFPDARSGTPGAQIADLLAHQGILVERLAADRELTVTPYAGGDSERRNLPASTLVVRLDQPESRAARAILERETVLDPSWLEEQIRRRTENTPSEFYDHTAWSLPLAFGAEAWTTEEHGLPLEAWSLPDPVVASPPSFGFLVRPDSLAALAWASDLMYRGVRVHVARKSFVMGGAVYPSGTLIVKKTDQRLPWDDVCTFVDDLARKRKVKAVCTDTAWSEEGIALGSDEVVYVQPPRIAVLYDRPASTLSYGWMAHLFEQRLGLPFTPIRVDTLENADLRRYNVLILPGGSEESYGSQVTEGLWRTLHDWVRQGGVLVTIGGASACVAAKGKDWTTARVVKDLRHQEGIAPKTETKPGEAPSEEPIPPEHRPDIVTGAALRVILDRHHWASWGFPPESLVLMNMDLLLAPSVDGRNVAVFAPEERLSASGFVWKKMRSGLPGKAFCVDEKQGQGRVILFAGDPNQRGY